MAHTPGPWVLNGWDVVRAGCTDAFPALAAIHNGGGALCMEEINANARLIAAAPELLAALKLLRNPDGDGKWPCYCNDPYFEGTVCENCVATAAIDKAEGRSE